MNGLGDMLASGLIASLLLPYLRVQACLLAMPGWGERHVPLRVRVALAMAVTPLAIDMAGLSPGQRGHPGPDLVPDLALLAVTEILIGVAMGLLVRFMAHALGMAASAIAAVTSLSQLVGGPSEAAPHPIGNLLDLAGIALLMTLGYPLFFMHYLSETYQVLPVGRLPDAGMLGLAGVAAVSRAFGLAMTLASPFILGGLLYQCLQGIVSRVMPALPVVFIGAPAALLLALAGLALLAIPILAIWSDVMLDLQLPALLP